MEKRASFNINLAKKKSTPTFDLVIHWAITGGRFLVILTETIAMGAFLYRFILDGQIVDLHDHIKAKQAIIATFQDVEQPYRELQERLIQTYDISQYVTSDTDLLTKISALAGPNNVTLKVATVGKDTMHLEITTTNILNMKTFIQDLQKIPELKEISIDRIEDRTTSAELAAEISSQIIFPGATINTIAPVVETPEGIKR
jgi:hypothetical protein